MTVHLLRTLQRNTSMLHLPRQYLDPARTSWHITFGTYGTRLHGSHRPTVDKEHNQFQEPFLPRDLDREASARFRMKFPPRYLTADQRIFVEGHRFAIVVAGRIALVLPAPTMSICSAISYPKSTEKKPAGW